MALDRSKSLSEFGHVASSSQASAYERMEPRDILHLHLPPHRVERYSNDRPEERLLNLQPES